MNEKYCLWCRFDRRVAVNLSGRRLEHLSEQEAQFLYGLIHPDIRHMVQIRRETDLYAEN